MTLRALLLVAPLAVAACSSQQPAATLAPSPTSSTASTPTVARTASVTNGGLAQITHDDLQTAIKIAQSTTPPDVVAAQCYKFLDDQLTALQGGTSGFIPPAGVVSVFETGRIGAEKLQAGLLSPAQRVEVDQNCGPLALSIQGDLAGLLNALGLQAISTGILIPKL